MKGISSNIIIDAKDFVNFIKLREKHYPNGSKIYFLFENEEVFKKISTLSGGERARVAILKLILSNANFLLLDEPTNHLDIDSKEVLEEALENYTGTIFTISHDRYFLNTVVDKILVLSEDGITEYLGNYDYYINKKREIEEMATVVEVEEKTKTQIKDEKRKEKEQREKEKKNRKKSYFAISASILLKSFFADLRIQK